jgi:hypothetical protein
MHWLCSESPLHAVSRVAWISWADASPEFLRQSNVFSRCRQLVSNSEMGGAK